MSDSQRYEHRILDVAIDLKMMADDTMECAWENVQKAYQWMKWRLENWEYSPDNAFSRRVKKLCQMSMKMVEKRATELKLPLKGYY